MLETLIEALSWLCILLGAIFLLIGAIGIVRFPDFWSRLHALSVCDSAGMILLVVGMMLQAGFSFVTIKLAIIGIFLFITGSTSTHAVANAAFVSGNRPPSLDKGSSGDKNKSAQEDEAV